MSAKGSWQPTGGVEYTHFEDTLRPPKTADGGVRNGMPEWKPYVRNPAIRAREQAVAAHLEAVRARIRAEIDTASQFDYEAKTGGEA